MSKQPKQTAREAKIQSLETFTSLLKEEPTKERQKKRLLSRGKMQSSADVRTRFVRYVKAIDGFNEARKENMVAKIELQRIMDIPLYESKLIAERRYWDCGIDDKGHFWFKNDPKSFEQRYKDFKRQLKLEETYDDADFFFDNETSGVPSEVPSDVSADVPEYDEEGFPNRDFEEDFLSYVAVFKKITPITKKAEVFSKDLNHDQQARLFNQLPPRTKASLIPLLSPEEQENLNGALDAIKNAVAVGS
jgi:hypothetical protein